jgi:TIR domain
MDAPTVGTFWGQLQAAGADVSLDEWSLDAGGSITDAVEDAIDRYDVLLLVWSTHAYESLWASRE